jgi:hypothetical protein
VAIIYGIDLGEWECTIFPRTLEREESQASFTPKEVGRYTSSEQDGDSWLPLWRVKLGTRLLLFGNLTVVLARLSEYCKGS